MKRFEKKGMDFSRLRIAFICGWRRTGAKNAVDATCFEFVRNTKAETMVPSANVLSRDRAFRLQKVTAGPARP